MAPSASPHVSAPVIPGHDVLAILAACGGRATFLELRLAASATFGHAAFYGNCHGDLFDFDGLLKFLESKGKLVRQGDDLTLRSALPHSGC